MLALSSSVAIGTSFIITKKGLMSSAGESGLASERLAYLQNPIWWAGMATSACWLTCGGGRSRQLCSIHVRTTDPCDAARRAECAYRVRAELTALFSHP